MEQRTLPELFDHFNGLTVLVLGDVMIDAYLWGKVNRISPEAPVPIVSVTKKENRLGGAANVALNIAAMGATPIIASVVGNDPAADDFEEALIRRELSSIGLVRSNNRTTTIKTRIISQDQHMLRVDEESTSPLQSQDEEQLLQFVKEQLQSGNIDAVVFEDYNKGVLTPQVIEQTIALAKQHNIPTAVDPKKEHFLSYAGVTVFKPNLKELNEGLNVKVHPDNAVTFKAAVSQLRESMPHQVSFITMSEHGVFVDAGDNTAFLAAHPRKIIDVSGAGDTVIGVATLCMASNTSYPFMAALANLAGGQVCEKVGVVPVDKSQLLEEAKAITQKIN